MESPKELQQELGSWPGYVAMSSVQQLLERNKSIIALVQANHEQRTPEALLSNQALLAELNSNVSHVVKLYESLAAQVVDSRD